MTVGTLLAVLCILVGFLCGILDEAILFKGPVPLVALVWFVAALAIEATINVGPVLFGRKREGS